MSEPSNGFLGAENCPSPWNLQTAHRKNLDEEDRGFNLTSLDRLPLNESVALTLYLSAP